MLEIGTHKLKNNVFLAPMAGITDAPFRDLCAREGAAYAASEMISSDALLFASDKTSHRIRRANNELPHTVQIAGSDPHAMSQVAQLNVKHGAEVIDINMGCPAKKVCNKAAGSALLEHPELVKKILISVVASVDVPVTLKIRTGPSPLNRNGVEIAKLAERAGIVCLAVHGRTRSDRFKGEVEYDTIAEIKNSVNIPVIANGDVANAADAKRVLALTCADGVMIGRAAQGNPWIFKSVTEQLAGRPEPKAPSAEEKYKTIMTHLKGLYGLYGEYTGVRVARKHIAWYCKGMRNATEFRTQAYMLEKAVDQLTIIEEFFACPEKFEAAA